MKIAIISDTHFGDPTCVLVGRNPAGAFIPGSRYGQFMAAAGSDNDYLVLVGDILDFSIASYEDAYNAAKFFFQQIQNDRMAKEIIYIPGNHDADLWHVVEHQTNIIMQIAKGKPPRPFKLAVPGILDDRTGGKTTGFSLSGVTAREIPNQPKYADLFLDHITDPVKTAFNFVYPNLYIVTDNESVLVTHGQYLQDYWCASSEWCMALAPDELKIGSALDVKEMVGINFPLSQLSCTGIGQAGPLTEVVRRVQQDVKSHELKMVKKLLDRLEKELDRKIKFTGWKIPAELATDIMVNFLKKETIEYIGTLESARFSEEFAHKKEVQERFKNYYTACLVELDGLRSEGFEIPPPQKVIFGHTHEPISWNSPKPPKAGPFPGNGSKPVYLYNTGGWLETCQQNGAKVFCGAEVFTYQTETGFKSIRIS